MFRNYFTLFHAARELHKTLAEGTFAGAHSQEKNQLVLSFLSATEEQLQLTLSPAAPKRHSSQETATTERKKRPLHSGARLKTSG